MELGFEIGEIALKVIGTVFAMIFGFYFFGKVAIAAIIADSNRKPAIRPVIMMANDDDCDCENCKPVNNTPTEGETNEPK